MQPLECKKKGSFSQYYSAILSSQCVSVIEESALRFVREFYKQLATGTTRLGDAVTNDR